MKKILLLLYLLLLVSCYSIEKNKWIKNKFVPIDKSEVLKNMKDYTLEIPASWYSYFGYHYLHHSPKRIMIKGTRDVQKVDLYVLEKNNIENRSAFFESTIRSEKVFGNKDIQGKIIKHEKYGDVLFLKFESIRNNENYTILNIFYFYKNKVYQVKFEAPNDLYKNHIDEALYIMNSFKINE